MLRRIVPDRVCSKCYGNILAQRVEVSGKKCLRCKEEFVGNDVSVCTRCNGIVVKCDVSITQFLCVSCGENFQGTSETVGVSRQPILQNCRQGHWC